MTSRTLAASFLFAVSWLAGCGGNAKQDLGATSAPPAGGSANGGSGGGDGSPMSGSSGHSGAAGETTSTGGAQGTGGAAGGGGASGSSGQGGAAGASSGGAPPACMALQIDGPELDVATLESEAALRPRLTIDADGQVGIVFEVERVLGPVAVPPRISMVSFGAWGAWPAALPSSTDLAIAGGDNFVVSSGSASGFAMAWTQKVDISQNENGQFLAASIGPSTPTYAGAPFLTTTSEPAFVSGLSTSTTYGFLNPVGANDGALAISVDVGGGPAITTTASGCATQAMVASGQPLADRALVAFSSSRTYGDCGLDDGVDSTPTHLQIVSLEASGKATLGTDLTMSSEVRALATAPRSDGMWVVTDLDYSSALVAGPIGAMRVDATGAVASPMLSITQTAEYEGPVAASSLADRLLFAYQPSLQTKPAGIRVELIDDTGILTTAQIAPATLLIDSDMSVLGSPDGTHVLVAWADLTGDGQQAGKVHVARLACVP